MAKMPRKSALESGTDQHKELFLTNEILKSKKDFLLASLESQESKGLGYQIFRGTQESRKTFGIGLSDLKQDEITENMLYNSSQNLGKLGVKGCNRIPVPGRVMKSIFGDKNYSIGDIELKTIANLKGKKNLFHALKIQSILDSKSLGLDILGITEPTVQLNGGTSILGLHVEHHNAASVNYLHFGAAKEWIVIPASKYLLAIKLMKSLLPDMKGTGFTGICFLTLSHRDIYFPPGLLKACGASVVFQYPGDFMVLQPSAIHCVMNHGMNMAESQNFLPLSLMKVIATYKTCIDSEKLGGEPLQEQIDELVIDFPPEDFIHESDQNREYKIRLLDHLKKEGKMQMYDDAVLHIKQFHHMPAWFETVLPLAEKGHDPKMIPGKRYLCVCKYKTDRYSDFKKHMQRRHTDLEVPLNLSREECPDCHLIIKDLSRHVICKGRKNKP